MSEQTMGSRFVAPQEMGTLEVEQTMQVMLPVSEVQDPAVTMQGEIMATLAPEGRATNSIDETEAQQSPLDRLRQYGKRITAVAALMGVVVAGAAACGEREQLGSSSASVSNSITTTTPPARTSTSSGAHPITIPSVVSVDPAAIRPTIEVSPCGMTDGPSGVASTDPNVVNLTGVTQAEVAGLLQTNTADIRVCNAPFITTAINDGKITTSEEYMQVSTGDRVVIWVDLDTKDANGYSAEANALMASDKYNDGIRTTSDKPTASGIQRFNGAIMGYPDEDDPTHANIQHMEGVISYDDPALDVTYDLRVAIQNGYHNENLAERISISSLDTALNSWLGDAFIHLKS